MREIATKQRSDAATKGKTLVRESTPLVRESLLAPASRQLLRVLCGLLLLPTLSHAQVAIRGETVYTMAGDPIANGIVVITDGKIAAVGPAAQVQIPDGHKILDAKVVTPGLIDAHATVGLTGIYNEDHDQDQLETSKPIQPELRAIDAYNTREQLVDWVRGYGITTVHTGHAPGELISGQTAIVKTTGDTVEDAVIVPAAAVTCTLSTSAQKDEGKSPGTRAKMMSLLRSALIDAQGYLARHERAENGDGNDDDNKQPTRDLKLETLGRVLNKELPLLVTANRAQDIANALRLAREFDIRLWLDGCAEAYVMIDEIKAAGVPVFIHPTMERSWGDSENLSFETAAKLRAAGIPVAMQSSYESYVPKVRVVLFEAAIAAANGLGFDGALATITIDAAKILGIADRVGSLEVGKDGDVALYDGDPFEYTTHCIGVVINGKIVSDSPR